MNHDRLSFFSFSFSLLGTLVFLLGSQGLEYGGEQALVVGGNNVDPPGKWPWQGSLTYLGRHRCGAVLIAPYWVITAAQCIGNTSTNLLWVTFGLHDKDTQYEGDPESYKLARIFIHPEFKAGEKGGKNDLALLQLTADRPADLNNEFIKTVTMATTDPEYRGEECFITGWGQTQGPKSPDSKLPNILQEARMSLVSQETCQNVWGSRIFPGNMCLSYNSSSSGCSGDYGGPLVCRASGVKPHVTGAGRKQSWILAGITSWAADDCDPAKPSVFSRMSFYRSWIRTISGI